MPVKGMIRRVTATIVILAVILFWTAIIATNDEEMQAESIMPGRSRIRQRHVMNVDGMCKLLKTRRVKRRNPNWSSEVTIIDGIRISMDEICEKEESFEDKAAPNTETVDGKEFEVVYIGIMIWDKTSQDANTVIESKHIQAFSKFLQMFAGCRLKDLCIYNKKMTQDTEELQKIRDTLQANPGTSLPISVKDLRFYLMDKAKATHPALLQAIIQVIGGIGATEEELNSISIPIAANHIQHAIQLLGGLKYKKLKRLYIIIEKEEQPPYGEAEKEPSLAQPEQEWEYGVEKLEVLSYYGNSSLILPSWLIRKPTRKLLLDMRLYMCLSKEGVESIKAEELEVYIRNETDQSNIESDTTRKKNEGFANEMVTKLCLDYQKYFSKKVLAKEKILEHVRCNLAWVATQFPSLTQIHISNLSYLCRNYLGLSQVIDRVAVKFNPEMQNLQSIFLNEYTVQLLTNVDRKLRTMPFVMRPKIWRAYANGQMEEQINKQLNLKENQEEYIRMQPSESDKKTEQFSCPICLEEFSENDESSWIYVTRSCRHAFCLACLNTCFKNENPICPLDNTQLQGNWRGCWRIEEAESNEYKITQSYIEESRNGKIQVKDFLAGKEIIEVNYQENKNTWWFEIWNRMLAVLWYKK